MNARRKEGAYTNSFWGKCALPLYWPYPAFARPFLLGTECPNAGKISCDFCVSRPNLGTEGLDILRVSLYNSKAVEIFLLLRREEKYRSGRNEPHSKCGCLKGHVGSNPTFSANRPLTSLCQRSNCCNAKPPCIRWKCRGFCALMHSEIQVRGQRLVRVLEFLQAEPEVGKGNFPLAHVGKHDIAAQDAFGC